MNKFSFKLPKPNRKQFLIIIFSLLGIIILGMSIYFGYLFIYNRNTKITSIIITNQTESSATIVWQTDKPVKGSIIVGGYKYYDSRDIEEIGLGEYELKNPGKRYTHYVTVPKLEAEREYEFQIKHDFVKTISDVNNFKTASVAEEIKDPDPVYGYVFDGEGMEINDAVVLLYVEDGGEFSQPLAVYVSDNGSFTLDVGMVRSEDLSSQISLPEQYWENIYVWSKYGEIVRRVDSRYDRPIGGVGTEGDRLQYGKYTSSNNETSSILNFSVSAGKDSPACSAGDSSVQVYGECCGNGKAREVRKCSDASTGVFYYKFSDCEHEASHCGGGGLDSKCNGNGIRDCEGYNTGNCESGVDCGNSVCGSCAIQSERGVSDHCKNGTKDEGLEEGTDCGGACPACSAPSPASEKNDACPPGGCAAPTSVPKNGVVVQEVPDSEKFISDNNWGGAGDYCISDNLYNCSAKNSCRLKKTCTSGCYVASVGKNDRCNVDDPLVVKDERETVTLESGPMQTDNVVASSSCSSGYSIDGRCCDMAIVDGNGNLRRVTQTPAEHTYMRRCSLDASCVDNKDLSGFFPEGCNECVARWDSSGYGCYVEGCGVLIGHLNYTSETCATNACENMRCGTTGNSTGDHAHVELRDGTLTNDSNCTSDRFGQVFPCENIVPVGVNEANGGFVIQHPFEYRKVYAELETKSILLEGDPIVDGKRDLLYEKYVNEIQTQDIINLYPGVYEVDNPSITTDVIYIKDKYDQVVYFDDKNGNGVKENDEPYLNIMESQGIELSLKKVSEVIEYDLAVGWNFVSFPMLMEGDGTSNIKTASDLIEEFSLQGVVVSHVVALRDGVFWVYTTRHMDNSEGIVLGEDFNILPGEGYIVYSLDNKKVSLAGRKVNGSLDLILNSGWNLVGIYHSDVDYFMSSEVISMFSEQNSSIDTMTQFKSGRFESYIVKNGRVFGFDFEVYPNKSYWVYMGKGENVRVKTKGK
ncbi:MAG TPA: fibronectin type III domain-containing protein [Candidatus Dojkabacteria bacterium]|nr:fibronectin type III domain-containing protein [Candidatus Dojkabacteria bacterium]